MRILRRGVLQRTADRYQRDGSGESPGLVTPPLCCPAVADLENGLEVLVVRQVIEH